VFDHGDEAVRKFFLSRMVGTGEQNKPHTLFSATLPQSTRSPFLNLFDVERQTRNMSDKQMVHADRTILKCLVTARLAGREINFQEEAASYEACPVPISILKTDRTMSGGSKSAIVEAMVQSAGVGI
jgi:hypothetical protein